MKRFLIEVPHDGSKESCGMAVQAFKDTGSHFVTNADWGCGDGEHKAWFTVELESKEEARMILPSLFREEAKIIELQKFSMETVDEQHSD